MLLGGVYVRLTVLIWSTVTCIPRCGACGILSPLRSRVQQEGSASRSLHSWLNGSHSPAAATQRWESMSALQRYTQHHTHHVQQHRHDPAAGAGQTKTHQKDALTRPAPHTRPPAFRAPKLNSNALNWRLNGRMQVLNQPHDTACCLQAVLDESLHHGSTA